MPASHLWSTERYAKYVRSILRSSLAGPQNQYAVEYGVQSNYPVPVDGIVTTLPNGPAAIGRQALALLWTGFRTLHRTHKPQAKSTKCCGFR